LLFDKEIVSSVSRRKWQQSQESKTLKDGRLELKFTVNGADGIKNWLYRWIPHVEVISPDWLRETVRDELKNSLSRYV